MDAGSMAVFAFALALVCAVGFAAHRASLCTVRAVAEIIDTRRARMLASFVKAAAWTALTSGLLVFAMQGTLYPALQRAPLWLALAGGLVFGIGAAINGGCALSTLQRLADGELAMLGTLLAFVAGLSCWLLWIEPLGGHGTRALAFQLSPANRWAPWVLAALVLWGMREVVLLWRAAPRGARWRDRLRATPWSLSAAALVLGAAGGMLYTLEGAWTWTSFVRAEASAALGREMTPASLRALFLLALVAGMALSSWQRGAFAWRAPGPRALAAAMVGGALMGLGAAILPGGNDTLVLIALPTLAPTALLVYAAVLVGVAIPLLLRRRSGADAR